MFSDSSLNGSHVLSSWKSERITKESESQTDQIFSVENGIQHTSAEDCEIQTSDYININKTRPLKTFNTQELLKFLTKASEVTIEEIEKSLNNDILNAIHKLQSNSKSNVSMVQKFCSENISIIQTESQIEYKVSSLSWNSNASILGVSYAVKDHIDWCTHDSYALLWNMYKTNDKSQEPTTVLEIDSCITVFVAHPSQPSIYGAGAMNGKIYLWNTRNSETEMLFASVMAHQSCVTALHWIQSNKKSDLGLLISCGLDGKIFCWKVQENTKSLVMQNAFSILAQDMPKSIPIRGNRSEAEVGIVSMSFNYEDSSIFIVGCHGGAIFQCSLNSVKPALSQSYTLMSNKRAIEFKSPIVVSYAAHRGHVNALHFSPFSRNYFFSCSVDSELRIYNILQTIPIVVIHTEVPLISAKWSPTRPNIAAVGEDGRVYIYSINDTKVSKPSFTFSIGDIISAKTLIYNEIESNEQIAISASNGEIQIWDLSSCTQQIDRKDLNDILKKLTDE
jgi:WD40 repeat protein